jgi:DNA-binding NarL/FixJ family response regulator
MDLHMPEVNGIEAIRQVAQTSPHIAILVLTMVDDDESLFAAMQAGARGYLLKGASKSEMLRAIRDVAAGAAVFSPAIAGRMMAYFGRIQQQAAADAFPELTEREREILRLIAQHASNQEIAHHLHLSPKTVRNYTSNIFAKLQVADRAEAIIRARDAGIGE